MQQNKIAKEISTTLSIIIVIGNEQKKNIYTNNSKNRMKKEEEISDVNKERKEEQKRKKHGEFIYIYCNLFQNETNIKLKLHLCVGLNKTKHNSYVLV